MEGSGARARLLFALAAVVIVADQLTKARALATLRPGVSERAIDGAMYWTLQRNPGAAFGLFQRIPVLFTILAVAITTWIVSGARRTADSLHATALGLVLGGALGNLVDRVARSPGPFRGHVVDFIDFRVWPVFNIADSAVVCGAALLVIWSIRQERRDRRARGAAALAHATVPASDEEATPGAVGGNDSAAPLRDERASPDA